MMANIYKMRDQYSGVITTIERYNDGTRLVSLTGDGGEEIIPPQRVNRNGTILKDTIEE